MDLSAYPIEKPDGMNVIIGQAHYVKTIEDLHEALAGASAQLRFGIAFCEASGPCLIRCSGNEEALIDLAARNAEGIGAGHSFVISSRGVSDQRLEHSENCLGGVHRLLRDREPG